MNQGKKLPNPEKTEDSKIFDEELYVDDGDDDNGELPPKISQRPTSIED